MFGKREETRKSYKCEERRERNRKIVTDKQRKRKGDRQKNERGKVKKKIKRWKIVKEKRRKI